MSELRPDCAGIDLVVELLGQEVVCVSLDDVVCCFFGLRCSSSIEHVVRKVERE